MGKGHEKTFNLGGIQMVRCSTPLAIEMQIKILTYHYIPIKMVKGKK